MLRSDWLIYANEFGYIQVECKNCGYRLLYDEKIPKVCPNCGADMRGEE